MNGSEEDIDLYAVLGLPRTATKTEIKKAYHKAALAHHPDKVDEADREKADDKFKSISQAYEILYDEEKREMYDAHGMAAFEPGSRHGPTSMDDIFAQFFGMGGMASGFPGGVPRGPRKGVDDEQEYGVTLEELYKGKTARFSLTKNVICSHCKGKGGKENAKPQQCNMCDGRGSRQALRSIGPGIVTQETVMCDMCKGDGNYYKDKDKCKKCKGKKINAERKMLEIYIPRGSKHGERIVLDGEADQVPNHVPGDLVFHLVQAEHPVFKRTGADLTAHINITLAEALCGFSRVVIKHLDGRGLHVNHQEEKGRVIKPGQILKIPGEGMPIKKSDLKGDLYLVVDIVFPNDEWLHDEKTAAQLKKLLPPPEKPIQADTIDEVEYNEDAKMDDIGGSEGGQWVEVDDDDDDDDEEMDGQPQCAQQ